MEMEMLTFTVWKSGPMQWCFWSEMLLSNVKRFHQDYVTTTADTWTANQKIVLGMMLHWINSQFWAQRNLLWTANASEGNTLMILSVQRSNKSIHFMHFLTKRWALLLIMDQNFVSPWWFCPWGEKKPKRCSGEEVTFMDINCPLK